MKKIFDVVAYESETPVNLVTRQFSNRQEYEDYVNSPNTNICTMVETEQCETIAEKIGVGARSLAFSAFIVGLFALGQDFCNGFTGCKAIAKTFKKRKAKKFLKKYLQENPDVSLEMLKGSEATNAFNEDEIEEIFKEVRGA